MKCIFRTLIVIHYDFMNMLSVGIVWGKQLPHNVESHENAEEFPAPVSSSSPTLKPQPIDNYHLIMMHVCVRSLVLIAVGATILPFTIWYASHVHRLSVIDQFVSCHNVIRSNWILFNHWYQYYLISDLNNAKGKALLSRLNISVSLTLN